MCVGERLWNCVATGLSLELDLSLLHVRDGLSNHEEQMTLVHSHQWKLVWIENEFRISQEVTYICL